MKNIIKHLTFYEGITNMLYSISNILYEPAKISQSTNNISSIIVMFLLLALIFYVIIVRPYHKRTKEHKQLMNSIEKGDEVLTSGGLIGRVSKINKGYIKILLNENVEIVVKKEFVTAILPNGSIKNIF